MINLNELPGAELRLPGLDDLRNWPDYAIKSPANGIAGYGVKSLQDS